jgi:dolichol-phosphate mannosyltransferase
VCIIDADLQDPPELIMDMYHKMRHEGYEVVYARRARRKGESWFKLWSAKWFYRILARITTVEIPVDTGDFRIMDRCVVNVLKQMPEQDKYIRGQISWIGFRQTYVEYERQERNAGETGYTFRKMMRLALNGITGFSNFPLRLVTMFGFAVSFIAFVVAMYALYSRFVTGNFVPGWASLIIAVLFLGGVQLLSLGIIGEYLARVNSNVRNRPLYIVRETNCPR